MSLNVRSCNTDNFYATLDAKHCQHLSGVKWERRLQWSLSLSPGTVNPCRAYLSGTLFEYNWSVQNSFISTPRLRCLTYSHLDSNLFLLVMKFVCMSLKHTWKGKALTSLFQGLNINKSAFQRILLNVLLCSELHEPEASFIFHTHYTDFVKVFICLPNSILLRFSQTARYTKTKSLMHSGALS